MGEPSTSSTSRGAILKPFDANGAFHSQIDAGNLKRLATRGAVATLFSGVSGVGIQLVSAMVLARLLTPRDFGLVTIVTTFSLLFVNFGYNGFTEAIVHCEKINHGQASNLFWMNVVGSTILAVGFALAGPWMGQVFHDPRISGVAAWISITIFLSGLSVIHLALLKRGMLFSAVSANDVAGRVASVIVSIALGFAGWGYWALVGGAIALTAVPSIGAWFLCTWQPGLPVKAEGTRSLVRYAVNTYARFSTGYFTSNLDNFLVGWRLGPVQLGLYKKAYDLFVLPSSQLSLGMTIVAVSALSRLQDNVAQYKKYLLGAIGVMALIGMGISGLLTLIGRDLVFVLLGAKWIESGTLFTIFAPGIGLMAIYGTHIWIHLSLGHADRWFRWGLIDLVVTTACLCIGLHWKAQGIALAWVLAYCIITLPALWYATRPIRISIFAIVNVIWRYVAASLASYLCIARLMKSFQSPAAFHGTMQVLGALLALSVLFAALYLGLVILLHGSFAPIEQVLKLFREIVGRRRTINAVAQQTPDAAGMNEERKRQLAEEIGRMAELASKATMPDAGNP